MLKELLNTLIGALASAGVALSVFGTMLNMEVIPVWFMFPIMFATYYVGLKLSAMVIEWDSYDVVNEEEEV